MYKSMAMRSYVHTYLFRSRSIYRSICLFFDLLMYVHIYSRVWNKPFPHLWRTCLLSYLCFTHLCHALVVPLFRIVVSYPFHALAALGPRRGSLVVHSCFLPLFHTPASHLRSIAVLYAAGGTCTIETATQTKTNTITLPYTPTCACAYAYAYAYLYANKHAYGYA